MAAKKRQLLDLSALGNAADDKLDDHKALKKAAGKTHNPVEVMAAQKTGKAKSRIDKNQIQGYFDPSYRKRLKILAATTERTVENLLEEAMNDLFNKHK